MKLFFRFISFILAALCLFSLVSCGKKERPICAEAVKSLTESEIGLPTGQIYSSLCDEGEEGYISDELLCALYGDGKLPPQKESWIEYSFFLSQTRHPCEIALILCSSPDSASDTARLLCSRLDTLKSSWKSSGEFSAYFETAEVVVIKNYVSLLISSDTDTARKKLSRLIG